MTSDIPELRDEWTSPLCVCPPEYSLNPYLDCALGCSYCYVSSKRSKPRPDLELLEKLENILPRLDRCKPVIVGTSSDPYPPIEEELGITRRFLEMLSEHDVPFLLITKSALVRRDVDLLSRSRGAVAITLTTLRDYVAKKLEPRASPPSERIDAIRELANAGVRVAVRYDPIIPGLNDSEMDELIEAVARAGAKHVVSATLELTERVFRNLVRIFPELEATLREVYLEKGERFGDSYYPPARLRRRLMRRVRELCDRYGLTFAACRQGCVDLFTAPSCDGRHLIPGFRGRMVVDLAENRG